MTRRAGAESPKASVKQQHPKAWFQYLPLTSRRTPSRSRNIMLGQTSVICSWARASMPLPFDTAPGPLQHPPIVIRSLTSLPVLVIPSAILHFRSRRRLAGILPDDASPRLHPSCARKFHGGVTSPRTARTMADVAPRDSAFQVAGWLARRSVNRPCGGGDGRCRIFAYGWVTRRIPSPILDCTLS